MSNGMKKRWISLYVENQVGVLSKISGLFSGKSYNLDSLTVGDYRGSHSVQNDHRHGQRRRDL